MTTQTLERSDVVERLANSPSVADLRRMTETTVSDLMRFGCAETQQSIGTWGQGSNACALTTAAMGLAALQAK